MDAIPLGVPEARAVAHRRLAERLFRGALAVTLAITAVWLFLCGSIPSTITAVPFRTFPPKLRDRRWTGLGRGL